MFTRCSGPSSGRGERPCPTGPLACESRRAATAELPGSLSCPTPGCRAGARTHSPGRSECLPKRRWLAIHVVLESTINSHRRLLGGRLFGACPEDRLPSSELAAACRRGAQGCGSGACMKHPVASESWTGRRAINSVVDAVCVSCARDRRPCSELANAQTRVGFPSVGSSRQSETRVCEHLPVHHPLIFLPGSLRASDVRQATVEYSRAGSRRPVALGG
jgi:hypothetical protein